MHATSGNLSLISLLSNTWGKSLDESIKTTTREEVTLGKKYKPTGLAEPSKPGTGNFVSLV